MLEGILGLLVLFLFMVGFVQQTTAYYQATSLAALTPAMEVLHTAKVGLLAAPFTPTDQTSYADVTAVGVLPTYTGYAEQSVTTWTAPYRDTDGVIKVDGGDLLFAPTDYTVPNSIYGWYLADSTDAHLLLVVIYDQPISLASFPDSVLVDVQIGYGE